MSPALGQPPTLKSAFGQVVFSIMGVGNTALPFSRVNRLVVSSQAGVVSLNLPLNEGDFDSGEIKGA